MFIFNTCKLFQTQPDLLTLMPTSGGKDFSASVHSVKDTRTNQ